MRKCSCGRWFDHRSNTTCPFCGVVPQTLQKLQAKVREMQTQITALQVYGNEQVERRRAAESERDEAIFEATAYARRCGELEAQLCAQLVEHPGRKAMLLVLAELRRAKLKHPHFADGLDHALDVLDEEFQELVDAVSCGDIHGEHGVIREAAQVGAVALRIIEMALGMGEVSTATTDVQAVCTCGMCMACQDSGLGR